MALRSPLAEAMDRIIPDDVRRRQQLRRAAILVALIALAAASLAATVSWLKPSIARRDVETARVTRGGRSTA